MFVTSRNLILNKVFLGTLWGKWEHKNDYDFKKSNTKWSMTFGGKWKLNIFFHINSDNPLKFLVLMSKKMITKGVCEELATLLQKLFSLVLFRNLDPEIFLHNIVCNYRVHWLIFNSYKCSFSYYCIILTGSRFIVFFIF